MKLLGRDGVSRPLRLQAWLLYLRGLFQGGRPGGRRASCRVCTEAQPGTKDATWFPPSCSESTVYLVTHLECWVEATTSKGHFLSWAPAGARSCQWAVFAGCSGVLGRGHRGVSQLRTLLPVPSRDSCIESPLCSADAAPRGRIFAPTTTRPDPARPADRPQVAE